MNSYKVLEMLMVELESQPWWFMPTIRVLKIWAATLSSAWTIKQVPGKPGL